MYIQHIHWTARLGHLMIELDLSGSPLKYPQQVVVILFPCYDCFAYVMFVLWFRTLWLNHIVLHDNVTSPSVNDIIQIQRWRPSQSYLGSAAIDWDRHETWRTQPPQPTVFETRDVLVLYRVEQITRLFRWAQWRSYGMRFSHSTRVLKGTLCSYGIEGAPQLTLPPFGLGKSDTNIHTSHQPFSVWPDVCHVGCALQQTKRHAHRLNCTNCGWLPIFVIKMCRMNVLHRQESLPQ